ncbi:hypothetical protein [Winogradskyella tangerina]|uniref:hypothetical protein n=1 Tax=Winogradskyella tangerina TaxID=2023240 RepID=UPI000DBE83C4|nr:hypothetical protein [Winogradskyella tangerina]
MKNIKRCLKSTVISLSMLLLFQSCRVYHRTNVSIDKAVQEEKRVKLKTKDGQKLKFKRIVFEDGQYYGVKRKANRTLIQPNELESIRLHDKTMSIIYGIIIGVVGTTIGLSIIYFATWNGPFVSGAIIGPW